MAQTSCASYQVTPDFDTSDTVYVDLHETLRFHVAGDRQMELTNLVLPTGYVVNDNSSDRPKIVGEVLTPGTYEFSFISTEFRTGCTDTVQFFRTYVESPTHVCEPITIRSDWNSGSEHWVGAPINMTFFVSDGGEDPPFTFSSPNLRSTARLDSLGHYTDSTFHVENYDVTIVVRDRFGCTDSLSYSIFTMCVVPEPMGQQTMTSGTTGQPYNQQVSGVQFSAFPPFSNFTTTDAIPPGLTLGQQRKIIGDTDCLW
ncbi:MAG: hypothetical protein WDO15_07740 [Bacteroidota bacterium]